MTSVLCLIITLPELYAQTKELPSKLGETLYFNLYVGFLNVGEGQLQIAKNLVRYKGKNCIHMRAYGRTKGFWRMIYKVDDTWGSYYDFETGYPLYFYRFIRENNYKKYETTTFNHHQGTVEVRVYEDRKLTKPKATRRYKPNTRLYDIVSVYYKLRSLRLDNLSVGAILKLPIFLEDTYYEIRIRYLGTRSLETDLGTQKAYLLSPLLPKNKVFSREDAVKIWISTDQNRLPLRVYADMKIGSVRMDLRASQNLKHVFRE